MYFLSLGLYETFFAFTAAAIGLSTILTLKGQLLELERLLDGLGDSASTTDNIKPGEYVIPSQTHCLLTHGLLGRLFVSFR